MRLAVVGGRGWLGGAIDRAARLAGAAVRVVSRAGVPGVVAADLRNPASLAQALEGVDVVVNAAGYRGDEPVLAHEANVALVNRLGRLAAGQGWRLVHLGSASEYGAGRTEAPLTEEHPCAPSTVYGESKLAGTEAVLRWRDVGAPVVVARVFNVAAADMPAGNPVRDLVGQLSTAGAGTAGPHVTVGDPGTVRDISSREWVAAAVVALALGPSGVDHPVVNVCSGFGTGFGELVQALAARLDVDVAIHDLGWRRGGRVVGDPARLRSLVDLPWPPTAADHLHDLVTSILGPHPVPVIPTGALPCHQPS